MLSYCFKCRRNSRSINPKVTKTTNGKAIILSTCLYVVVKKQNFLKSKKQKDY